MKTLKLEVTEEEARKIIELLRDKSEDIQDSTIKLGDVKPGQRFTNGSVTGVVISDPNCLYRHGDSIPFIGMPSWTLNGLPFDARVDILEDEE